MAGSYLDAQIIERQSNTWFRHRANLLSETFYEIISPRNLRFLQFNIPDYDDLMEKVGSILGEFVESRRGIWMLSRCSEPKLVLVYSPVVLEWQAAVHGVVDYTAEVEWRLICAND